MINITIIGFGYVGSSLSLLLLNSQHPIRLNIMEPNPQREGALLDLAHASSLYTEKELYINNEALFLNADFIYYAAGTSNPHGTSRLSTAGQNIQLSKEIFAHRIFNNNPYVIVITNPVDIISQSVLQITNLPPQNVIGTGTFLDSVRLAYYLSSISTFNATDFETVVVGEHGDSQVPVYSSCTVNKLPILNHPMFSKKDLENVKALTKNAAFQIRETQGATTYGVAKCAAVLLDYFLSKEEYSLTLSMLTNEHYRSLLSLKQNIYIGMPVAIKKGVITINNDINMLEEELDAYRKSAEILLKTVKEYNIY